MYFIFIAKGIDLGSIYKSKTLPISAKKWKDEVSQIYTWHNAIGKQNSTANKRKKSNGTF